MFVYYDVLMYDSMSALMCSYRTFVYCDMLRCDLYIIIVMYSCRTFVYCTVLMYGESVFVLLCADVDVL